MRLGIRLGARGCQRVKEPLRKVPGICPKSAAVVRRTRFLTLLCNALYKRGSGSRVLPADHVTFSLGKKDSMMFKVEDFQSYGKEQFEGMQAIATAYGDYSKKSY